MQKSLRSPSLEILSRHVRLTNHLISRHRFGSRCYSTQNYKQQRISNYLTATFPQHVVPQNISHIYEPSNCAIVSLDSVKSLISLRGVDTLTLLQGVVTHNVIERFGTNQKSNTMNALNCAILNSRGRMLFDTLLTSDKGGETVGEVLKKNGMPNSQQIFMETESVDRLVHHLSLCKIRSKVEITRLDPKCTSVYAFLGGAVEEHVLSASKQSPVSAILSQFLPTCSSPRIIQVPDPRLPQALGYRLYLQFADSDAKQEWEHQLSENLKESDHVQFFKEDLTIYQQIRMLSGIAEGPNEMQPEEALPIDYNYDLLDGIHWDKGCYVGQELTARTHFTGQVRKRLFPVFLKDESDRSLSSLGDKLEFRSLQQDTSAVASGRRERSAGKLIAVAPNGQFGIGLVRFENVIPKQGEPRSELAVDNHAVSVAQPLWMNKTDLYPEEEEEEEYDEEEDDEEVEWDDSNAENKN